ncbi:DUF336-domain-containing protein [Pleomassaria siparia CBS 279.74]|uniref:DUF336-domain-containing protein n=1 Tax=Pleomassaria siparia CBS 279.74 TaxID=1314801 RepID=A0A6G1KB32_9PLEO|nr:DUF336-domain-containing protein [Pleomassaria siparia CBS 279.74]
MKLSLLLLLPLLPSALTQNLSSTNGIGSTPAQRHYVTAAQAQTIIAAAVANATAISVPQNVAIVDPSGLLVAFLHMDNAYPGSIDISIKKARTAVLFNGLTSEALGVAALPGGGLYGIEETNGGLIAFGGGIPIYLDGYLIGGAGVSGGTVAQDIEVVTAGVVGLGASTSAS